ncbi:MAG: hypothetical protein ACAI35_21795 [Candidatus Methylacidiphilales bacterium]
MPRAALRITPTTRVIALQPWCTTPRHRPTARNFTYDDAGSLLGVTEPAKGASVAVSCTYDALNRVLTETSGGATHSYTYDLAGNRLQTVFGTTCCGRKIYT